MNYSKPSKIQQKALPLLLANPPRNMIAQSQSGTGKTAAFVITVLSRLDYTRSTSPQALVLAPSRELARQIEGVFGAIGCFVEGLTVQAAVPGSVCILFYYTPIMSPHQAVLMSAYRSKEAQRCKLW